MSGYLFEITVAHENQPSKLISSQPKLTLPSIQYESLTRSDLLFINTQTQLSRSPTPSHESPIHTKQSLS